MDNIIPTNEYTEVESRLYANPQIGLDETNTFIDNLRATQGQQNQEITQQTQNLGTNIPTNLGGLTGAEGYFTSRYQTPQTNAVVANLRATAQAQALNDVLANEQAIWRNRYQQAYRDYQKRQYDKTIQPSTTGGSDENIEQATTTQEIGDIQTEGIAKSIYQNRFNEYIKQGMTAQEAEIMAKQSLGLAPSTQQNLEKKKAGNWLGNNSYIYTLPNGNTVLVNEDKFKLVNAGNQYFLQDLNTKSLTRVGG